MRTKIILKAQIREGEKESSKTEVSMKLTDLICPYMVYLFWTAG